MPQHWDRLTTDTLGSNEWFLGLTRFHTEMRFVDVLKKQALVGTARKSLRWESIATQSIAGVVQIEDLLSQWRSQVPKRYFRFHGIVLSPTHSWLNQDQKSVPSILQKLF